MPAHARIELRDLHLACRIGHYAPGQQAPDIHVLDLSLTVAPDLVQVGTDDMAHVFDYDPLLAQIDLIARARHYTTQEYLLTRIATECAAHPQILGVDGHLRKGPVLGGMIGVRLVLAADDLAALRDQTG
jgi:dihydroneopterin aldolase